MLSDKQIKKLIHLKKVTVTPYDESNLKAGKYDVHLGRYVLIPKKTKKIVDLYYPKFQPQYGREDISKKSFILNPGQFILGQTLEVIGLDSDIGMFIDGSTTMARLGILIHLSSTFIPPGQDPHIITLEIFNAGAWKVALSYKVKVGKLLVFKYSEKNAIAAKTFNRYNGQREATGAKIESKV